jgi:ABC-type multidrug transport system ATPase subunit
MSTNLPSFQQQTLGSFPGLSFHPQVLLNGRNSNMSYGVSAYVTQDEVLVGVLSVRETLTYSALLRLPSSMTYKEKVRTIRDGL